MLMRYILALQTISLLLFVVFPLSHPVSAQTTSCVHITQYLQRGSQSSQVVELKRFLSAQGLLSHVSFSTYLGTATEAALKQWQSLRGIEASGTTGPVTRRALAQCGTSVNNTAQCPSITRTLYRTTRGNDVLSLQLYLISQNFLRSDSATGFYGILTEQAVRRFQALRGIEETGTVGFLTRAALRECLTVPQPPTPTPTSTPIPTYTWITTPWSACSNAQQARSATCVSSNNQTVFDGFCASSKPATSQSCTHSPSPLPVPCNPLNSETRAQACPVGQVGAVTLTRTSTCPGPQWSNWATTTNTCAIAPVNTRSCTLDGLTIAHNTPQTFYSARTVAYGQLCASVSQSRTCTNGAFSGSDTYVYGSCTSQEPRSCTWNGSTIPHGTPVTANLTSTVPFGQQCQTETRTCNNGTLSGTYAFASCVPGTPQACLLDGVTVNHGTSRAFHSARTVAYGQLCASVAQVRTCTNGTLSGAATYQYASCVAQAPVCTPDATSPQTQTRQCPSGQTGGITETRTSVCAAGAAAPSWTNWVVSSNTCTDIAQSGQSCTTPWGSTIAHGVSATYYNKPLVPSGKTCAPHAQTRVCTNGTMSGDIQYHYSGCTVSTNPNAISYPNPDGVVPVTPSYSGTTRTESMPDTLDLVDRAVATITALTSPLYAPGDYTLYWSGQLNSNPARLNFGEWEDIDPKFWEGLPLMRIMTGATNATNVDRAWEARAVKSFDPHYKLLLFSVNKPFVPYPSLGNEVADWASLKTDYVATVLSQGRIFGFLSTMYRLTGNEGWKTFGTNLLTVLPKYHTTMANGVATFYPSSIFNPFGWPGGDTPPSSSQSADISGRMIQGPALFALATQDARALPFAKGFATFMMKHSGYFDFSSGAFHTDTAAPDEGPMGGAHFMRHSKVLDSLVDYVAATARQGNIDIETRDFVIRSYQWIKAQTSLVNTEIGWFPEFFSAKSISTDYGVIDMVSIAVKLSAMGYADYWDDVDAWTRNHFASQQLLNTSWISAYSGAFPYEPNCDVRIAARGCTFDNVAGRLYGSWGGWSRPNEFTYMGGAGIMQDSSGNAPRTLFHVWNSIVTRSGSIVSVNLPLNKIDRAVTVKSYIPHSGALEVVVRDTGVSAVRIRVPGWVTLSTVTTKKNGAAVTFAKDGRYVIAHGPFVSGDTLRLDFPISETVRTFALPSTTEGAKMNFTFTFRGNQVIDVSPDGERGAFYTDTTRQRAPATFVTKTGFMLSNQLALDIYPVPAVTVPPPPEIHIYASATGGAGTEGVIQVSSGANAWITWRAVGFEPNTCIVYGPRATPLDSSNVFNGGGLAIVTSPQGTPALTESSTYTLQCNRSDGTKATASVLVNVTGAAHFTANPSSVAIGQSAHMTWSSPEASACFVYGPGDAVFNGGGVTQVAAPGQGTPGLTETTTYALRCQKADGTKLPIMTRTVFVNDAANNNLHIYANAAGGPVTEGAIQVSSGGNAWITWNASGVLPNTCTVYGPRSAPLDGSNIFNGSGLTNAGAPGQGTSVLTQTSNYTLECLRPDSTKVKRSVTVFVQ